MPTRIYTSPISDSLKLQRTCEKIRNSSYFGIDTEFSRRKTYRAHLELIQISTERLTFCVDVGLCENISTLFTILHEASCPLIFHAADQDLDVLHQFNFQPNRIFDTQIAAKLCGYERVSYKDLVGQVLRVSIDKNMTQSDWGRRPFSRKQIHYALQDVLYLHELHQALRDELIELGRLRWLEEECQRFLSTDFSEIQPSDAWKLISHCDGLSVHEQHIARRLLVWREARAQRINWPRQWVLKNDQIFEIAKRKPQSKEKLAKLLGKPSFKTKSWMNEIINVCNKREQNHTHPVWEKRKPLSSNERELVSSILKQIARIAEQNRLSPALICSRKEAEKLVRRQKPSKLISGWRKDLLGDTLDSVLK